MKNRVDNVAGVKIPKYDYIKDAGESKMDLTGLAAGGQQVTRCRDAYSKTLELLVSLASLQSAFLTLDVAIKTTNRRVNALENVVKPRVANTIAYIKVCPPLPPAPAPLLAPMQPPANESSNLQKEPRKRCLVAVVRTVPLPSIREYRASVHRDVWPSVLLRSWAFCVREFRGWCICAAAEDSPSGSCCCCISIAMRV